MAKTKKTRKTKLDTRPLAEQLAMAREHAEKLVNAENKCDAAIEDRWCAEVNLEKLKAAYDQAPIKIARAAKEYRRLATIAERLIATADALRNLSPDVRAIEARVGAAALLSRGRAANSTGLPRARGSGSPARLLLRSKSWRNETCLR